MEGITSNKTINQYIHESVDDLKTKVALIQSKTQDVNTVNFINKMKFTYTLPALDELRKQYLELDKISNIAINEQQKNNALNIIGEIKSIPKQLSVSQNIYYFKTKNIEPKILSKALSEIINVDKNHGYIALNNFHGKLQYIIIANPEFVDKSKFNANQIIQQINRVANGSGGGRHEFAQGGTSDDTTKPNILSLIAKL
ncbi:hypothetical protein FACS1894218_5410 [Bacilli bacterium]|nr:hypothetical protein FACS1894218_5410 [Bacilli bacterium]